VTTEPPDSPPEAFVLGGTPPTAQGGPARERGSGVRRRAGRAGKAISKVLRDPEQLLALLLLLFLALRVAWLEEPGRRLIFDEAYYVSAARVIIGLEAGAKYEDSRPGLDPNTEHPPLGKLLIAASISVLGDNGIGWRLPSVIAGMLALIAIYRIVRALHPSAWLAVLVVALLALDNLTFVHARIGMLDMLGLAPMLTGAWLAIERRWVMAGVVLGISLLIKLTALYAIGAVLLYVLLTEGPAWWRARAIAWRALVGPAAFTAVAFALGLAGLWFLDLRYTTYTSPFEHLERIVSYGAGLHAPPNSDLCEEIDSRPWQWLFNQCQITYLRVNVTVREAGEIVSQVARIDFRGALNPILVGAIPLSGLFTAWYAWRTRSRLAMWAIAWAAATYLPYLLLAIVANRITYLYYMLPVVPALAVALGLALHHGGLPRPVRWGFLLAYVAGFIAYFPFRSIPS
jgi:dolichyl-phosphate-mannose-protein mannosyltransferase